VVIDHVEDLCVLAALELPVGDVGLPHLVWQLGLERIRLQRGRFWGCATTRPSRFRMRQIVEREGTSFLCWARW